MTQMTNAIALASGLIVKNPPSGRILMGVKTAGDGVQAPGSVVLVRFGKRAHHAYAVWFHNRQDGGYHGGDYCKTFAEGIKAFADRIERTGPHLVEEPTGPEDMEDAA